MSSPLSIFPAENETIEGVGALLRAGKTSCAAVLEHCFHQIDLWDEKVHAWVVVDRAGAMRQARALDAELAEGKCRGPLHGIPIGIKDIIDVEGLPTAAGFRPWRERVAAKDAEIVARLRKAGAVILGKTVTTQFAWVDPPPTRNPWNLDRTPGGSSSGSAAAVATGMCLGAIGTQTGGSIIRPASFCGVAGYKPKYGLVPTKGVLPLSPSLDHPGPIARTVRDLTLMSRPLHVAADEQSFDMTEVDAKLAGESTRLASGPPPILCRPRGFFDRRADVEMLAAFERALGMLQGQGARIVELPEDACDFEAVLRDHRTLMACEASAMHEARFAEHRDDYAPHIHALVEEGLATPATRYVRAALEWRDHASPRDLFLSAFHQSGGRCALATPATVGAAPDLATTGNPCFNSPFSYFGCPALSFPIGLDADGLPLAIQLAATNHHDLCLIASWCESVIRGATLQSKTDQ